MVALAAVSQLPHDAGPSTIVWCVAGVLTLAGAVGCSAAVWALTCAFETTADLLCAVIMHVALDAPLQPRERRHRGLRRSG